MNHQHRTLRATITLALCICQSVVAQDTPGQLGSNNAWSSQGVLLTMTQPRR